jgi:ribosomal-protein-alanine N-acetyltransferase
MCYNVAKRMTLSGEKILPYLIRPMAREDLTQVNAIDREAFPTQWPPANYRQELQNRLAHYIVASDDSKTVDPPPPKPSGGLSGLVHRLMPWLKQPDPPQAPAQSYLAGFSGIWMMADEAHITNIAVRREHQGKGLGGLLLIATIDLARELKASFLTLEVRASNLVAQNLYTRYGFSQTGLRRGYYLDNHEDAIIMSTERIASPAFQARLQQLRDSLSGKLS